MVSKDYQGIFGLLQKQVDENPDKCAVIMNKRSLSYRAIANRAQRVAARLYGLGVRQGDRVGLIMPTSEAWIYAFWGIQRLCAICVPLAPGTGRAEIVNVFKITEVKVCFAITRFQANELVEMLKEVRSQIPSLEKIIVPGASGTDAFVEDFNAVIESDVTWDKRNDPAGRPDDLYVLMSTSGSVGIPKIIPKRWAPFMEYLSLHLRDYDIPPDAILFSAMPPFHMLCLSYFLIAAKRGATIAFLTTFDADQMLDTIAQFQVTDVLFSATNAKMMLLSPNFKEQSLASVGTFWFSGEFCPDEVAAEFYERRPFRVINIIGSTEVSAYLVWDSKRDKGHSVSQLTPFSFVELKLLHENGETCKIGDRAEIFVSHGDLLQEYYQNLEASEEAIVRSDTGKIWFRTGDMAIPLPAGRYQFVGRKKRVIKRGATLIYPEEVEGFLMKHPEIQATAIIKEDDAVKGESMKAFVELKAGSTLGVMDIIKFCQGELGNHQIPDKIEIVEALPRETGKIQLKKLRQT